MTDHPLTIRPYLAETDLAPLSALWFEASLLAHGFIGEARLRAQRDLVETVYFPKAETWVAVAGHGPLGFISLLDNVVGALFVAPKAQGQGVGRALVGHALELKGALTLDVYTANAGACAFYHALGFTEISRRGEDAQGLPFETARMRLGG